MLQETLEPAWVAAFEAVLARCALKPGDVVAVLSESQSRPVLPQLARMAAARMGCQCFAINVASVFEAGPAIRSTGASTALQQLAPVVAALAGSTLVLVLAEDDANLTFKRYIERPITLRIENDYITAIEGAAIDADLMRSDIAARDDPGTHSASAAGRDAYALYSNGANEVAGRHTRGHFDLPLRNCTVALDGIPVVDAGKLVA
jgi:hypothetical protein